MPPVNVEELFPRSALSDDPVFVAYHEHRDTRHVAENGVAITESNVQFVFFEPGEISILTAESAVEGDMSTLVDHVCRHFGVTDVAFVNVLSTTLAEKLHGFEETTRTLDGDPVRCLVGTWQPSRA